MAPRRWLSAAAAALLCRQGVAVVAAAAQATDEDVATDGDVIDVMHTEPVEAESSMASTVHVMEHGFVRSGVPAWKPRGTLMLSEATEGKKRKLEPRLSDAQEFLDEKQGFLNSIGDEAEKGSFYAVRMYSPTEPRRVLQASIPAKLLSESLEDWHDILEVSVSQVGVPISLSYRVRYTLGLALFDHTQVNLVERGAVEGPRVPPRIEAAAGKEAEANQSFFGKYWWAIMLGVFLMQATGGGGDPAPQQPVGGGKGGQGSRKAVAATQG